ncbi:uncharacterized protein BDR25DRAFT_357035 [Lindgomyces ingoldianus]|uniref:Uncharacterized protein n=1 Tax=Lindgomyces ingoldianus TaxID=673940 RepID=A0ACB6QP81_9PLEO|nr:uncharacterized protein BDR25DRAFT_357035 [Lindgomyces ingoldianus]KAF2468677.1 hypothetical protein BDR25DRAFT_357035 [Lindgomyces ingoldianus]
MHIIPAARFIVFCFKWEELRTSTYPPIHSTSLKMTSAHAITGATPSSFAKKSESLEHDWRIDGSATGFATSIPHPNILNYLVIIEHTPLQTLFFYPNSTIIGDEDEGKDEEDRYEVNGYEATLSTERNETKRSNRRTSTSHFPATFVQPGRLSCLFRC